METILCFQLFNIISFRKNLKKIQIIAKKTFNCYTFEINIANECTYQWTIYQRSNFKLQYKNIYQ